MENIVDDFTGMYVTVAFGAIVMVAISQASSALENGTTQSAKDNKSIKFGTIGATLFLVLITAFIVAVRQFRNPWYTGTDKEGNGIRFWQTSKYVNNNPRHLSPGDLGHTEEWYEFDEGQKQSYWEPNVQATGMAKLVMSGKPHFKFKKDSYGDDHDYSRDSYRDGEEELRAYRARKIYEYEQSKKKKNN